MITQHDLQEAIAECQGQRNPNASTCIKLAAFLIIQREMFSDTKQPVQEYSYNVGPVSDSEVVDYSGESEFAGLISGRKASDVWPIMDELMQAIAVINPPLYKSVLRKIDA